MNALRWQWVVTSGQMAQTHYNPCFYAVCSMKINQREFVLHIHYAQCMVIEFQ